MEEDVTDASDVVETIQRLSKASHTLSMAGAVQMQQIPEVSKVVMEHGIARLVAKAAMLVDMSADDAPIVAFKHHSSRLPSGKVVHRKAKQTEEFLVRNQFVRCTLPDGRVETRAIVHDPVPTKHGKGAHASVEVAMLGAQWDLDRFALSALERIWRQVRAADAPCHDGLSPGLPQTFSA